MVKRFSNEMVPNQFLFWNWGTFAQNNYAPFTKNRREIFTIKKKLIVGNLIWKIKPLI
jgi:hypothetical protein